LTARVDVVDRRISVQTTDPRAIASMSAVPGARHDAGRGVLFYPRTLMYAERIRAAMLAHRDAHGGQPTMTPAFGRLLDALRRFDAADRHRDALDLPDLPTRTQAWPHQRQAFWWALERGGGPDAAAVLEPASATTTTPGGGSGLALEMGTGKSLVCVGLAEGWRVGPDGPADVALILCPLSVLGVWPREFRKHAGQAWSVWAGHAFGPSGKLLANPSIAQRAAACEHFVDTAHRRRVPIALVVHYDVCWRDRMRDLLLGLARAGRIGALILDESHRAKSHSSKTSQFAARLAAYVDRVVNASGTMLAHSELDLFGQFKVQDPGIFGPNWTSFRGEYAVTRPTPTGKGVIVVGARPDKRDEIAGVFHRHAIVKLARDVLVGDLALPEPLPPSYRTFELSPKARRIYDALDDELTAAVGDGTVTVPNVMVKTIRLMQIACGHVPVARPCPTCQPPDLPWTPTVETALDDALARAAATGETLLAGMALDDAVAALGDDRARAAHGCPDCAGKGVRVSVDTVDDGRGRLLADHLTDVADDEPVVVHCQFRHDLTVIERVVGELGRPYGELSGRRRDGINADGEMNPGVVVLGCQVQSGGVGIDLTRSALGVWYSVSHKLEHYVQGKARRDRPGQTRSPRDVHLVAENTIDRLVYWSLRRRKDVIDSVIAHKRPGLDYDALDDM
jgi:hypothetical protein